MGSFDGAEICELVGTFMLSEITKVVKKTDIGLYRDDGLGLMRRIGKPEIERRKKKIIKIFKSYGLKIIINETTYHTRVSLCARVARSIFEADKSDISGNEIIQIIFKIISVG